MVMGRPREYDREAIAKSLLEWAAKDDSVNLNAFCTTHDPLIPPSYLTDWARQDKDFSVAYETAKAFLGHRRETKLKNNELHVKAYDLNASVYDYYLKEEKRRDREHDYTAKERAKMEALKEAGMSKDEIITELKKQGADAKH